MADRLKLEAAAELEKSRSDGLLRIKEVILRGGNAQIFFDETSPETLIVAAAGTGKSWACIMRIHKYCDLYPGTRALIVRKTRKSLTESALVTFEKIIEDQKVIFSKQKREQRHSYDYPNGSTIVVGGMDDPVKIMSTDFDLIYVQESVELTEDDWEMLTTRLRNYVMPFQQIFGDTNPSYPTHWLKKRCDKGQTKLYKSYHEDNPVLHDGKNWTKKGRDYLENVLDKLSGPRKDRLRWGKWVAAEGIVYTEWRDDIHLRDWHELPLSAEIRNAKRFPNSWPRYIAIDFGYRDPCAILWAAEDTEGRLYIYRQIYRSERLIEDHAKDIKFASYGEPIPRFVVCDHDLGERKTVEKYTGFSTVPAKKSPADKLAGIQAIQARLRVQPDGKPRLFVLRDSLLYEDRKMIEAKKPTSLVQEIESYIWKDPDKKEEPEDGDDHALDTLRYLIAQKDLGTSFFLDVRFIG